MIMELKDHEADMKTKDGKKVTLSWYVKYLPESESTQEGAICLGRDISEHQRMKSRIESFTRDFNSMVEQKTAALRKRTNQLVKLLNIGEVRVLDADIGDIMSDIADVVQKIGWEEVLITRRMSDGVEPGILASRGFRKGRLDRLFIKHNPLFIETVRLLSRDNRIGSSYLLSTKTHGPVNARKFSEGARWDPSMVLVTPLKIRNKIIGFIYTFQPLSATFPNEEELGFLEIFARRAAVAIENIALLSEMKEKTGILENANRVKMDYFTQMSHELRTPLNSILAIAGVLMNQLAGSLNAEQQRQIRIVQNNGERLLELINDILDIAKIESGKMELRQSYFKLAEGMKAVSEMIIPLCETKNIQFDLDVTRHAPQYLFTDRDKFEQVLTNILSNAVKHTGRGKIRVLADADRKKKQLLISISDTGSGIEKRDLKAIFEPFHQSDVPDANNVKGTGLGLSISKHLWEMMEGTIAVESKKGRGTTFRLTLPLRDMDQNMLLNDPKEDTTGGDAINEGTHAESERQLILIVDDNKDNQYALNYVLEEKGHRVLFARDGNDGVRIAKKERPALILMDMMMPGMDGYEATRKLRAVKDFEKTPIIAMTAKTKAEDDGKAIAAGCSDYLSKPFKANTVLSIIDYWLRNPK
jgi:signal transduction histidine kinase/CheY-like chemotaxis protein